MTLLLLLSSSSTPTPTGDADVASVKIWHIPQDGTTDEGDRVRCFAEFRNPEALDANGKWALVDPDTVAFRVHDPSGGSTSTTPDRDSLGRYHADISIDEPGVWTYRFEGSGSYQGAKELEFAVTDSAF